MQGESPTLHGHIRDTRWNGLGGSRFSESSPPRARMISDSLEVKKQKEKVTTKGVHARFEPGTLKSLQIFSVLFPTRPLDFKPRVRHEKKSSA